MQSLDVDPEDFDLALGMDAETGFVEVSMRHGDFSRPLQCDELSLSREALAEIFSRNLFVDTPEGPVAIPASDWLDDIGSNNIRDYNDRRVN